MEDWDDHRREVWEGDNKARVSLSKERKAGENVIEDIYELYEDIPTSITVTGDEWWLKFHGQADELPWPQEEVDDDSLTKTYGNTPWSTLNLPFCDEDYVTK